MVLFLSKVRLTALFIISSLIFYAALLFVRPMELSAGQLALFSVTSILFGFYFGPILDSQKNRVMALNQAVREQTMTIMDILANSHLLPETQRHELKIKLKAYVDSIVDNDDTRADNQHYDELLRFAQGIEDEDIKEKIYDGISETQDQRDSFESTYAAKLYSHEWMVMIVLFSITLFFIIQTDYGTSVFFRGMLAVLCAGLVLLMAIMAKYATLTHKKAKAVWKPMHELIKSHFEDVKPAEVRAELANSDI